LTVIPRDGETAEISAGSVDLDGPFIERVNTGAVRIRSIPDEPGLAVCATVPAGARVRVFHDRLPIGGFSTGVVIQDGRVVARSSGGPKTCASLPVLQGAILGR
jgi:hypothetical protein